MRLGLQRTGLLPPSFKTRFHNSVASKKDLISCTRAVFRSSQRLLAWLSMQQSAMSVNDLAR
jgi:hypothetical protein